MLSTILVYVSLFLQVAAAVIAMITVVAVISIVCCSIVSGIAGRTGFLRCCLRRQSGPAGIDIFSLRIKLENTDLQEITARRFQAI